MKKIVYILALSLLVTSIGYAQDYKKFRVGLGLGYAAASGNGSGGGVIVTVEPSYRVQDNLSIGLRWEAAAITRGYSEDLASGSTIDVAAIGSFTLNGQYYFGTGDFRPFGGLGLGLYSLAAVSGNSGTGAVDAAAAESKFGFYPRIGFDFHHFSMSADYNIIPPTKDIYGAGEFKNSYFGIRLGFFIGGGKAN
jgi:hypothetical protein